MFESIQEAISANQAEAATYSAGVQVWMKVMAFSFVVGAVFAPWKQGARWILAALVVNIAGLILIRAAVPGLSREVIGTGIHLSFWTLVLFMVWGPLARERRQPDFAGWTGRAYAVWLVFASLLMAVSLALDARTALSWIF
jgi:hypothetical protein